MSEEGPVVPVTPVIRVVSAELQEQGRYLITQRSARAVLPLLWEFPGGRVRDNETDEQALMRALKRRLGVEIEVGERVMEVRHDYPDYTVDLAVYRCSLKPGPDGRTPAPFAQAVHAVAWVAPEEFGDYPFPDADQKTVAQLINDTIF
jgi:8-oxo-dGTP diphosphatase